MERRDRATGIEPPDWALPSWDAIPDPKSDRPGRDRGSPSERAPGERASSAPAGAFGLHVYSVSEVTRTIRDVVHADVRLSDVWVEGEVGRVTISSAGHAYFSLKDERNQLQCVWFRDDRMLSAFEAQAGLRVVAHGRLDLYEPTGALQLYVDGLQPAGHGDLALRFEELKARLSAEGLFDRSRKRPLPVRPATIAVVTSPSGAVWHDIRTVLARRWPLARVVLSPCQVQGEAAPASIVRALRRVERWAEMRRSSGAQDEAPAVTILARGGGSLEDLWAFNDERVVRAVVTHTLPVACGVGHETDVTLADFAADVRAPTPSAAAELVVPDQLDMRAALAGQLRHLQDLATRRVAGARAEVLAERRALERLGPEAQILAARERIGLLLDRSTRSVLGQIDLGRTAAVRLRQQLLPTLPRRVEQARSLRERSALVLPGLARARVEAARTSLRTAAATLGALGPQATLERGYAIVRRLPDGRIVRDPAEVESRSTLRIRVARGEFEATTDGRR